MAKVKTTPWTVRTTKRKASASAPPQRKRQRASAASSSGSEETEKKMKQRQQTLTQIQFMPRVVAQSDEEDLQPVGVEPQALGIARTSRTEPRRWTYGHRSTSKLKRNSTLTQMDFLNSYKNFEDGDQDNGMQLTENDQEQLPQIDGAADRRRRMPAPRPSTQRVDRQVVPEDDTQEYRPSSRKRKILQEDPVQGRRRISARLASTRISRLETRHEAEYNQENEPLSSQDSKEARILLRTPSKARDVIPSSQSPESLPPSTRKKSKSLATSNSGQNRPPLRERTANVESPSRFARCSPKLAPPTLQSPKTEICILRASAERLRHVEAAPLANQRINHSIWTPASSSPSRFAQQQAPKPPGLEFKHSAEEESPQKSQDPPARCESGEHVNVKDKTMNEQSSAMVDEPEASETSQYESGNGPQSSPIAQETQGTLPSLSGLLGLTDPIAPEQNPVVTPQMLIPAKLQSRPLVAVRDFANPSMSPDSSDRTTPHTSTNSSQDGRAAFLAPEQETIKPNVSKDWNDSEEDQGEDDEFGTPIANDTQFNVELSDRLASSSQNVSPLPSPIRLTKQETTSSTSQQFERGLTQALPTPRLVHGPSIQTTTQSVPLNDILSPTLPSRHTQRVVYPASLPRQSQVSTQDPTQPYAGTSSMSAPSSSFQARQQPITIKIKDSSSIHLPLHEISSQPRNVIPASDDEDDLDMADDLDAPYIPPVRQAAPDRSFGEHGEEPQGLHSALEQPFGQEEDSQVLPPPTRTEEAIPAKAKKTRLTKPRKPVLNTQVRALIGSSCLDAIPDPPGWSQRSFDDELI